jgi:hypothetical protein
MAMALRFVEERGDDGSMIRISPLLKYLNRQECYRVLTPDSRRLLIVALQRSGAIRVYNRAGHGNDRDFTFASVVQGHELVIEAIALKERI